MWPDWLLAALMHLQREHLPSTSFTLVSRSQTAFSFILGRKKYWEGKIPKKAVWLHETSRV